MSASAHFGPPDEAPGYSPLPPRVRRPLPTTVLWRWRYEIGLLLGISTGGYLAGQRLGGGATLLAAGVTAALVATIRPLRRAVCERFLSVVVTPHRIRLGLAQAWVHNRSGRLPAVLRSRHTGYGEAILLWCPAGVCERHVRAAAEILRAACWARHVQVTADPRHRHLVTVHVIRRALPAGPGADVVGPYEVDDVMQHG